MYDIAIIGGGPAGLTAAIYARRYNMSTILFTKTVGGLVTENPYTENYPGFKKIDGAELSHLMGEHAEGLGAEIKRELVKRLTKKEGKFILETEWGTKAEAGTVVVASGLKRRALGAKNEEKFKGRGVSYCAICDGAFFKDRDVAVLGGGDSAGVSALILSGFARKVFLVYRRDKFYKMQPAYIDTIKKKNNIEVIFNDTVTECLGGEELEGLRLKSEKELKVRGLFVEIGFQPEIPFETNFTIETDARGFIKVDGAMSTSIKGLFAAGDITTSSNFFHQIVTAAGEGSIAADSAYKHSLSN